ncbi:MAG: tetratricopeptide repeat protein, partial [Candidatus Obscuribacterales bacterium]|nr:tetratricopeptide repeat protein [Candidatus Obscuribacterales bacterium]
MKSMILACQKLAVEKPHRFPLFLLLAMTGILSVSSACADTISNAPAQISCIEQTLNGQSRADLPLQARLENLEATVFGHPGSGALKDRIIQLKNYLGVEEKARALNPPVAKASANKSISASKTSFAGKPSMAKVPTNPKLRANVNQTASQNKTHGYLEMPIPKIAELPSKDSKNKQVEISTAKATSPTTQSETNAAQSNKQAAIYEDNEDLAGMMKTAMDFYSDGKVQQAEKAFRKVLKQYPDCVDAYYNLGSISEHKGDKQAAIDYYSKALNLSPNDKQLQEAISQLGGKNRPDINGNTIAQAKNGDSKGETELKGDAVDNASSATPRDFATNKQSAP